MTMADEYIERAVDAYLAEMARQTSMTFANRDLVRDCVTAAIEAWGYGGVTLAADIGNMLEPTIRRLEDGSWERIPLPIKPLSDGR
jgi:hypothetical protein